MKRAAISVVVFFVCMAAVTGAPAPATNEWIMATGNEQGLYYQLGQALAKSAAQQGVAIRVIPSSGSAENLEWLQQRKADVCLAQSDTVKSALQGAGSFSNSYGNLRGLAILYSEPVHILVRNPLRIRKIEDMARKRVSVGPAGSGTEQNALAVLAAGGLCAEDVVVLHLDMGRVAQAFNDGMVDVAFVTAGCPSPVVDRALRKGKASLFGLSPDVCLRLLQCEQAYVATTIQAGTYPLQSESRDTVGVSSLLMARADLDKTAVASILKVLATLSPFESGNMSRPPAYGLAPINPESQIPVHPAAADFFENDESVRWPRLLSRIEQAGAVGLVIAALVFGWLYRRRVKRYFFRYSMVRAACVFSGILGVGSFCMYLSEWRINDNYATLLPAFWSTLCNWLNFGQKEPYSTAGRVTSTVMTIFGLGAISWLTAQVSSIYTERRMKEGEMCDGFEGHIVILNWNAKGKGVVRGLLDSEAQKKEVVILTDHPGAESSKSEREGVFLKPCDSSSEEALKSAGIAKASSVIILGDDRLQGDADVQNVFLVLAVKKILRDARAFKVHLVVEMSDPRRAKLSDYLASPEESPVEIVSAQRLAGEMIVQVAVNPGLMRIYDDLLTFGAGSNEVYRWEVRNSLAGKTIVEAYDACAKLRTDGVNIIPLAIERNGALFVNPAASDLDKIEKGDILYAICDRASIIRRLDS